MNPTVKTAGSNTKEEYERENTKKMDKYTRRKFEFVYRPKKNTPHKAGDSS
jgi:hypothetical protein